MLDSQVADTSRGVHFIGGGKGVCRASVEASRARAAPVGQRLVRSDVKRGDQFSEEKVATESLIEHHGVLSDPADPGGGGQLTLEQGGRVDTHPESKGVRQFGTHPLRHLEQLRLDHLVVILPPGVHGHPPSRPEIIRGCGWVRLVIQPGHDDDALRSFEQRSGLRPLLKVAMQIFHRPRSTGV